MKILLIALLCGLAFIARAQTVLITLSTNSLIVREAVTVRWSTGTNVPSFRDFIAVYHKNAPNNASVFGTSVVARVSARDFDRTFAFFINAPGTYEARYVRQNTYINPTFSLIARSIPITVYEPVRDPELVRNYPSSGQNIIAFGDSLVVGLGAPPGEDMVSEVSRRLCCRTILNRGVSGNTTADALARLDTDVLDDNPKIVIVVLGGNDFLRRLPATNTFNNLKTIVERIHNTGAIVVLVGVQGGRYANFFSEGYRRIAEQTGCVYIPNVLQGIIGNFRLMSSDLVHPNEFGYEFMARRIAPTVALLDNSSSPQGILALSQSYAYDRGLACALSPGQSVILQESDDGTLANWQSLVRIKRTADGSVVVELIPSKASSFYRFGTDQ